MTKEQTVKELQQPYQLWTDYTLVANTMAHSNSTAGSSVSSTGTWTNHYFNTMSILTELTDPATSAATLLEIGTNASDGSAIPRWENQFTGSGATSDATQETGSLQPTYDTSSEVFSYLDFDGTDDTMVGTSDSDIGSDILISVYFEGVEDWGVRSSTVTASDIMATSGTDWDITPATPTGILYIIIVPAATSAAYQQQVVDYLLRRYNADDLT